MAQGKDIAIKLRINEPYLEQIMISLKAAGLVRTFRGRNGGYTLGRDPESISLLDIIQVCEGEIDFSTGESFNKGLNVNDPSDILNDILKELSDHLCKIAAKHSVTSILARCELKFPEYVI